MSKGRESKLKDFYVVRLSPPTSTPPSSSAWGFHYPSLSKASTITIDFQGVNGPLQQEIIHNLLTQVYPNTYNLSRINITKMITNESLSHNVFDLKWKLNVWMN